MAIDGALLYEFDVSGARDVTVLLSNEPDRYMF